MFGIGMPEMILILAVALIVFGPKKLPELGKSLGRALGEFRRATNEIKESIQIDTGLNDVRDQFKDLDRDLKGSAGETRQGASSSSQAPPSSGRDELDASSDLNPTRPSEEPPRQAPEDSPRQDKKIP